MKTLLAIAVVTVLSVPAFAQAPQQSTVDQLLALHSNIEANLAKQLDAARAQIAALAKENAELKKQVEKAKAPASSK